MKKFFAPLIIILLILTIYQSIQSPDIVYNEPSENTADFLFSDVEISLLRNGKKVWTINASESQFFESSKAIFFQDIQGLVFFQNSDNLSFEFTSPLGTYKIRSQFLSMVKTNSILRVDNDLYLIICDEIDLNAKTQQIMAYGNVQINSNLMSVNSQAMHADLLNHVITLKDDVEGSINTN